MTGYAYPWLGKYYTLIVGLKYYKFAILIYYFGLGSNGGPTKLQLAYWSIKNYYQGSIILGCIWIGDLAHGFMFFYIFWLRFMVTVLFFEF